jgi:hypothetical protein
MDVLVRRTLIATGANPDPRLDYVVELEGSVAARGNTAPIAISLRYIPEKVSWSRRLSAATWKPWHRSTGLRLRNWQ